MWLILAHFDFICSSLCSKVKPFSCTYWAFAFLLKIARLWVHFWFFWFKNILQMLEILRLFPKGYAANSFFSVNLSFCCVMRYYFFFVARSINLLVIEALCLERTALGDQINTHSFIKNNLFILRNFYRKVAKIV